MRQGLYNIAVSLYGLGIGLAKPFNSKARLWKDGRRDWQNQLKNKIKPGEKWVWFHCASLGEFEQGRNLMETLRKEQPNLKILVTFFSPSGYEIRKNYSGADYVCYLPLDTPGNAGIFLDVVQPVAVFFIKYELWVNYLREIWQRKIQAYLVSAILRKDSRFLNSFFAPLYREAFLSFSKVFTQNEETKHLLEQFARHPDVQVTGDTRFDRVLAVRNQSAPVEMAMKFAEGSFTIVCGSTWPKDEAILLEAIQHFSSEKVKWIVAPHEIHPEQIAAHVQKNAEAMCTWSSAEKNGIAESVKVLWIDNIGMLSRLYAAGSVAWVGGAFGKLVHNTLEPAVFGNPVFFGPHYKGSDETVEMIDQGTAFSVNTAAEFIPLLEKLLRDPNLLETLREKNRKWCEEKSGATEKILEQIKIN